MTPVRLSAAILLSLATAADAQVAIHPSTTRPADWERFALRVVNATDDTIVSVRVAVPDAVTILGVDAPDGWTFAVSAATDTSAQVVEWSGGSVAQGEFREFPLLGRVKGDAKRATLVFPVFLIGAGGERREWVGAPGSRNPAPRVTIVGRTVLSVRGVAALAGGGIAIALIALALALTPRRTNATQRSDGGR